MAGCNLVDLMDLSTVQRQIIRQILRKTTLTYEALSESLRAAYGLAQAEIDAGIADLTEKQWIAAYALGADSVYRVNLIRRSAAHNQAFWNRLGVDPSALNSSANEADDRSTLSGGKRTLPAVIWESLEGEQPLSRDSLRDVLRQSRTARKEPSSELGRALRKRVYDALNAVAGEQSTR